MARIDTLYNICISYIEKSIKNSSKSTLFTDSSCAFRLLLNDQYGVNISQNSKFYHVPGKLYKSMVKKDQAIKIAPEQKFFFSILSYKFNAKHVFSNLSIQQQISCRYHWHVCDNILYFLVFYGESYNTYDIKTIHFGGVMSLQFQKLIIRINRRLNTRYEKIFYIQSHYSFSKFAICEKDDEFFKKYTKALYLGNVKSRCRYNEKIPFEKVNVRKLPSIYYCETMNDFKNNIVNYYIVTSDNKD